MIYIALPLTLLLYALTKKMYAFRRIPLLNPVLIPCILIIILLISADLSLEDYQTGTSALTFLLEPSIVALAIPLYLQFKEIKKQAVLILLCCLLSVFISVSSAVFICHFLGIDRMIAYALTTRSITTPLAISATNELGGIPSIAVAIVCIAGICGAVMGFPLMKRLTEMQREQGRRIVVFLGAPIGSGKSVTASFLEKLSNGNNAQIS